MWPNVFVSVLSLFVHPQSPRASRSPCYGWYLDHNTAREGNNIHNRKWSEDFELV